MGKPYRCYMQCAAVEFTKWDVAFGISHLGADTGGDVYTK